MTNYTIENETTYTSIETAKSEAESLISEGMGPSFQWTSEWEEEDGILYREYEVDGGGYETEIEIS